MLFFAGALAAHVHAWVFPNIGVPGAYFALAIASVIVTAAVH